MILALVLSHLALPALGAAPPEWRELTPPSAVSHHALLYDHVGDRLLLFGGYRNTPSPPGALSELWSFGSDRAWRRIRPAAPHVCADPTMVLDTRRYRLVAFGNYNAELCCSHYSSLSVLPLTTEETWTAIPNGDLDFVGSVAVYDSTLDRVVTWRANFYFGSSDALTREFRFTGGGWQVVTTTGPAPPANMTAEAHLDRALRRMIVVDRTSGGTWTLDLATMVWQSLGSGGVTGSLGAVATGFDVSTQRLLAATPSGVVFERPLAPTSDWHAFATGPAAPPELGPKIGAWDPGGMRFLFHGGVPNEVWQLSLLPEPRWESLAPARPPAPYSVGNSLTLDSRRGNVLLGSGFTTYVRGAYCSSWGTYGWKVDLAYPGANWSISPSPGGADWQLLTQPGGGNWAMWPYASSVYDPVRDRALYFGGYASFFSHCVHGGEMWAVHSFNVGAAVDMGPAHTIVPFDTLTAPPPRGRYAHGAVWDARRDRMLVAGGNSAEFGWLSDLWQLDGFSLQWLPLATTGIAPAGELTLLLDERRERVVAAPTDRTYRPWDPHLYFLDLATMTWTRVQPTGGPSPPWITAVLDPIEDRLFVLAIDPADGLGGLWQVSLDGPPTMTRLSFPGSPPITLEATAVFDAARGTLVVHGGYSEKGPIAGGQMRSTWMLQLYQPTATHVDFASIEAMRDRVRIVIQASTAGQSFEVERRIGEEAWTTRATVSADGTGRASWEDREVSAGGLYAYRVSWWDGGTRRTSAEREVRVPGGIAISLALDPPHPNPAGAALTFSLSVPEPGPVDVTIHDVVGRIVLRERIVYAEAGRQQRQLQLGALRPGMYLLRARAAGDVRSRRFLVAR